MTDATDLTASVSPWLQADHDNLTGKVLRLPDRVDITITVGAEREMHDSTLFPFNTNRYFARYAGRRFYRYAPGQDHAPMLISLAGPGW